MHMTLSPTCMANRPHVHEAQIGFPPGPRRAKLPTGNFATARLQRVRFPASPTTISWLSLQWLVVCLPPVPSCRSRVGLAFSLTLVSVAVHTERPVVISGPSGVGKGTLYQKLLDAYPETFATTVSHTTRKPRPGEVEGTAYYFVSRDKFESLIAEGTFLEFAEFNGNLYGTSKQTVMDQTLKGSIVLLDIEMEGVKQLQAEQSKTDSQINARVVFIKPPSLEALEARLRGRGTEDEESIQRRLAQVLAELEYAETGVHDKIIINDDLDRAFQELEGFIFERP
ncbi:guanylate kinase [Chaetomium tenue]|uniref:Guanylate kinase n=1 Tax=Chaetomium tenue TaxID=1854479 RepID=A0ACB7P4G1_9PEZI|nr:guanylate kinase [Chaetomium globosum]